MNCKYNYYIVITFFDKHYYYTYTVIFILQGVSVSENYEDAHNTIAVSYYYVFCRAYLMEIMDA